MYAVAQVKSHVSARRILDESELLPGEALYDGELTLDAQGRLDMRLDFRRGLRAKTEAERLEDAKQLVYDRIKQWACDAFSSGFATTIEIKMDCDVQSIAALHALYTFGMVQGMRSLTICDYDNVTHLVSWDEFEKLLLETGAHHQKIYARKWELRQLASKAESEKDLEALSWE